MSTDSSKVLPTPSIPSDVKYIPDSSQGDYWGGYMLDFSTFKWLAIFPVTGFLGIDHLALRSPITAMMKFLVNVCFWGAWYFYDIIQVSVDNEFNAKYGFTTPWGPRGHGYRLMHHMLSPKIGAPKKDAEGKPISFNPQHPEEYVNKAILNNGFMGTFMFILYAIACLVGSPVGLQSFIAGDGWGGVMKLISLIFMITIPYHFFTGIFDFFNSGSVAKDGVPRTQPFVNPILMPMVIKDDNRKVVPATNLIPKEVAAKLLSPTNPEIAKQNKYASENESWFESFSNTYFGGIGAFLAVAKMLRDVQTKLPQIIDKKYGLTNPATALASAKDAATGAVKGAIPIDPSQVSSFEVTNPLKAGLPDPKKALASVVPAVPSPAKYTDLVESMKVPLPGPQLPPTLMKQAGGGDEGGLDSIFLWGVGALVLGGFALTFFRKMVVPKRKDENEYPRKTYERDDAPPNPGGV